MAVKQVRYEYYVDGIDMGWTPWHDFMDDQPVPRLAHPAWALDGEYDVKHVVRFKPRREDEIRAAAELAASPAQFGLDRASWEALKAASAELADRLDDAIINRIEADDTP